MDIEGVPESIDRTAFLAVLKLFGFDIERVRLLELRPDGVYVTAKWRDADGKEHVDGEANGVIQHRVYVPMVG